MGKLNRENDSRRCFSQATLFSRFLRSVFISGAGFCFPARWEDMYLRSCRYNRVYTRSLGRPLLMMFNICYSFRLFVFAFHSVRLNGAAVGLWRDLVFSGSGVYYSACIFVCVCCVRRYLRARCRRYEKNKQIFDRHCLWCVNAVDCEVHRGKCKLFILLQSY